MADVAPEMTFEAVPWSDDLARRLDRVPDAKDHRAGWADMIERGAALALVLVIRGQARGAVIWGIEDDQDGQALVIHAAQVDPIKGRDMTAILHQVFDHLARNAGARRVRFWTQRPGLVRKARALGYRASYVCERAL